MNEPSTLDEPAKAEWPPEWLDQWVLPYITDSTLWPVLFALLGHVAVALAPLLLATFRGGSLPAAAGLFLVVAITFAPVYEELRHIRRPGPLFALWTVIWAMGGAMALILGYTGLL